jgi:hypothetical protein
MSQLLKGDNGILSARKEDMDHTEAQGLSQEIIFLRFFQRVTLNLALFLTFLAAALVIIIMAPRMLENRVDMN